MGHHLRSLQFLEYSHSKVCVFVCVFNIFTWGGGGGGGVGVVDNMQSLHDKT